MSTESAQPVGQDGPHENQGQGEPAGDGSVRRPNYVFQGANVPAELRAIARWVAFRLVPPKKPGDKWGKVPVDPKTGKSASTTDPTTWGTYERALLRVQADGLDGVGFVFNGEDYCGIDLDHCRDAATGVIASWAQAIIDELATYCEASPSGTGVHLILRGKLPPGRRRKGDIEMYDEGRFFTVTGNRVEGTPATIEARQAQLEGFHAATFAPKPKTKAKSQREAPESDDEIVEAASNAKNGEKFKALWGGSSQGYASDSEADLALCSILAFWADGDPAAVDRLFRRSARMRAKWDERHGERTYGQKTVDLAVAPKDGRIERIDVLPGHRPEVVQAAHDLLHSIEPPEFFQLNKLLVRLVRLPDAEESEGVHRPAGSLGFHTLDEPYTLLRLAERAEWYAPKRGVMVRVDPPREVAQMLLANVGGWKFQHLIGFVESPTLRGDGSILATPGYDSRSRLYFDHGGVSFGSVLDKPTIENARAALAYLLEPFAKFPFSEECDRTALAAAILTALVRRSLPSAPMFVFDARTMGTGKSLLADAVSIISTGRNCSVMTQGNDVTEDQKRIFSILLEGDLVACIDNIERPLEGADLCAVLTQSSYKGRILGFSKTAKLPTRTLWLATGNNVIVRGDLITRVVPCDLDAKIERPEQREFEHDLREQLLRDRPNLVRAALTIMRAYVVAGRPKQPIPVFGRFEKWSAMVRSPLVWLGMADPLLGVQRLRECDPSVSSLRAVQIAWRIAFRSVPTGVAGAIAFARSNPAIPLFEALSEVAGFGRDGLDSHALGVFLRRHRGRVVDGLRFETSGKVHGVTRWIVVEGAMGGDPSTPTREITSSPSSSSEGARGHARTRIRGRDDPTPSHPDPEPTPTGDWGEA